MKRTPILRGSSRLKRSVLHPGKVRLRRTQMKRVGKRREREAEALAEFNRKMMASYMCAGCREWMPAAYVVAHHMAGRGRCPGHPMLHDLRNRAWTCRTCHEDAHSGRRPDLLRSRAWLDSLLTDTA